VPQRAHLDGMHVRGLAGVAHQAQHNLLCRLSLQNHRTLKSAAALQGLRNWLAVPVRIREVVDLSGQRSTSRLVCMH